MIRVSVKTSPACGRRLSHLFFFCFLFSSFFSILPSCLGLFCEVAAQFARAEIPRGNFESDTFGQHDGIAEAGRCGPHVTVPICTVHQIWMRVSHRSSDDRSRPHHHPVVSGRNWCVRPHLARSCVAVTRGRGWGRRCPPFQFHGSPSMCWWTDDTGVTHEIWQGEGGEQCDPSALYACGQHRALVHVSEDLLDSERLLAFMDDIYVISKPDRTEALPGDVGARADPTPSRQDATVEQRRSGPRGWERLTAAARRSDPSAVVWKGDPSLPVSEQGLRILGTRLGHPEYVHDQLRRASADHRLLLIPAVQDLQSAWLWLSFCAGTRANHLLRPIPPPMALEFAANHTVSLRTCLQRILDAEIPPESWEVAVLPLSLGGYCASGVGQG